MVYFSWMSITEPSKRKLRKKKQTGSFVPRPPLLPHQVTELRGFIYYGIGDPHLTSWEENFLNSLKNLLCNTPVWLSDKRQAKIQELTDKLNYDRQDVSLPLIDPDGMEENDDPDGWPVVRDEMNLYEDDEWLASLQEA